MKDDTWQVCPVCNGLGRQQGYYTDDGVYLPPSKNPVCNCKHNTKEGEVDQSIHIPVEKIPYGNNSQNKEALEE